MTARRRYSRLKNIEKKRNIRTTFIFGFLTIALIFIMFFFGLPLLIRLSSFIADIGTGSQSIDILDSTPPPPPRIDTPPSYTNENTVKITGTTESGATVKIFVNKEPQEVLANADGRFNKEITLKEEENTIYATSADTNSNESGPSTSYKIVVDKSNPILDITEPTKTDFYGSENKVNIKGTTDSDSKIYVNDRFVVVSNSGEFTYQTTLSEGENNFTIKAIDRADNEEETNITLKYSP